MNFGRIAFAIGIIATGVLTLVNRGFWSPFDPIPKWVPAPVFVAYAFSTLFILGGVGLTLSRTAELSARVLFAALLVFLVVLKTPEVLAQPLVELSWLDYGEIAVVVAGAWTLAATTETSVRAARYLMGAAVLPIGLSHFVYLKIAMPMVPAVLPFHQGWVIFTGIAHCAAGVAVLAGVMVRLATFLEASMLTAFMVLVWLGPALTKMNEMALWVSVVATLVVACGVWAVASKTR